MAMAVRSELALPMGGAEKVGEWVHGPHGSNGIKIASLFIVLLSPRTSCIEAICAGLDEL